MKKTFSKFLSTLLGGVLLCAIFASCENFMKGGTDVRKEVEAAIEYNNAQSCTVNFSSLDAKNNDVGSFLTGSQKTMKIGYSEEIQFKVKTNDYIFETLEAVNINDDKPVPEGCITFNIEESSDETTGLYRISVRLLQKNDNILIRPVCKLRPKVVAVSPVFASSGCDQDTMIEITFNKEMELKNFGDFSCISIYSETELMDYFDTPFLSGDKKTLCIQPKQGMHLISPDDTSTPVIHVRYDFTNIKDKDNLFFTQKDTHDYRINSKFNGQKKVDIKLEADEKFGKFLSTSERAITIGSDIEVQFQVNQNNCIFQTLQAMSQKHPDTSYAGYISEFTLVEDDNGIYKLSFKVIKELKDKEDKILITPVCLEYPKVESFSPSSAQLNPANTQITITFNTEMEDSVIQKILITPFENNNSPLFETPTLDSSKKILTIIPKTGELMDFIGTSGGVTISVSLPSSITVNKNGTILPLKQNENSSFEIRYKSITDITPPDYVQDSFYVTRQKNKQTTNIDSVETFSDDIFLMDDAYIDKYGNNNLWSTYSSVFLAQQEKAVKNRMGKSIYLYGQFTDTESGIRKITVYENYHGNDPLKYEENPPVITDYYNNSSGVITFHTNSNGVTTFCINHELKSEDGSISLQVAAVDFCGNTTFGPVIIGFKRTHTVFELKENFQLHNSIVGFNYTNYSEELLSKKLRTLTLSAYYENSNGDPCGDSLYGFDLPVSMNEISCKYINSEGILKLDKFQKANDNENEWTWNLELDVEQVNGLTMEIIIEDDTGNKVEKVYTIPPLENFTYIEEYTTDESWPEDYYENHVQFFYSTGEETCNRCFQIIDSNGNKTVGDFDKNYGLESNNTYYPLPCYLVQRVNSSPYIYFYIESPQDVELKKEDVLRDRQDFDLENYQNTDKPYLIVNSSTEDRTIISIKIPESLWSKGCDSGYVLLKSKGILPPKDGETEPQIGNKYYLFNKDSDELSVEVRNQDLFASATKIVLCGTVNNLARYEKEFTIPKLDKTADKNLDNKRPDYSKERISPEDYRIKISDTESGPNYGNFYERAETYDQFGTNAESASLFFSDLFSNNNKIKYTADSSHSFQVDIPAWFFEEGLSYYVFDKNNNLYCGNIQSITTPIYWDISTIKKSSDSASYSLSVTCNKITNNLGEKRNYIYVYKYKKVGTAGEWILINKKELSSSYANTATISLDSSDFNTEQLSGGDYFIKIITSHNELIDFWHSIYEERDFSAPYIAYLNCPAFNASNASYDSSYDLILNIGGSQESVAISSQSPVFVQTAITWQPYEVCKDWSAEKWTYNRRIRGEKQLDFDNSTTIKRYDIPIADIQQGQCYCVIAHFADGHTEKSQVMQK